MSAALCYVFGLLTADMRPIGFIFLITALAVALFLLTFETPSSEKKKQDSLKQLLKRRHLRIAIIFLMLAACVIGYLKMNAVAGRTYLSDIYDKNIRNTSVTGEISEISYSGDEFSVILTNPEITISDSGEKKSVKALGIKVFFASESDCIPGDIISCEGTLSPCGRATNEGQFDSLRHNLLSNTEAYFYADTLKVVRYGGSFYGKIKYYLSGLAYSLESGIKEMFPQKEAGLICAIITGDRSGVDEDTRDLYSQVGIAHILSVSGLHVTLLGMAVYSVLMKLTHRQALSSVAVSVFVFIYAVLTGFSISAMRAFVMLTCSVAAKPLGRAYDGRSAGALAALIILIKQPLYIYDSGFLLSFFAVFGIFAGNTIIEKMNITGRFLKYVLPSVTAQLAVLPIVLRTYYSFSPYGILANLVLLPLMSALIFSGLAAGIAGSIYLECGAVWVFNFGKFTAGPAYYILRIFERFSNMLLKLPKGNVVTGCPSVKQTVIYYILFFILIFMFTERKRIKKISRPEFAVTAALFLTAMPVIILYTKPNEGVTIDFLDVGQGQCIYVEADEMKFMIDGGSTSRQQCGKYIIKPFLMWHGTDRLDFIAVTHTDADHTNGLKEILESGISCENVFLTELIQENDSFLTYLEEKGIGCKRVSAGDRICDRLRILGPDVNVFYESENSSSMIALFEYGEFELLITGDSDTSGELLYTPYAGSNIDVIQVPHHGSKYSSSEYMIEALSPRVGIISCAKYNSYGHPAPETVERYENSGCRLFKTFEEGRIEITADNSGKKYNVSPFTDY